jgi:ribosome modulation factor
MSAFWKENRAEDSRLQRIRGPFKGAWRKGYLARKQGEPEEANPYLDVRQDYRESVTWSRGFRRAWLKGWRAADEEIKAREREGMP